MVIQAFTGLAGRFSSDLSFSGTKGRSQLPPTAISASPAGTAFVVPVFSVSDADYYPLPGTDRLILRASRLQRLYLSLWDRFEAVSDSEQSARLLSLCYRVYCRYSSLCVDLGGGHGRLFFSGLACC
jgi:hypothetical protein